MTSKIILRRNGTGLNLLNVAEHIEGISIINKDVTPIPVADVVVRWGTTSNLPGDPKVINTAKSIHRVFNKGEFRKTLANEGLAPKTYDSLSQFVGDQIYPVITRPNHHSRSEDLYFCTSLEDVVIATEKLKSGYYISEYIKKTSEYRIFVVQGRVVAVIKKKPRTPDDITWGCVEEGTFEYVPWDEWPLLATQKAVQAFLLSKLHFGAVDVIARQDPLLGETKAYVLEINTAPEVTPYYGKCLGKSIDHMIRNDSYDVIPVGQCGTWKSYIHPAISALSV